MLEALTLKNPSRALDPHREALRDVEEYYSVKNLLAGSAVISYQRHNARVHQAMQAAAAAAAAAKEAAIAAVAAAAEKATSSPASGWCLTMQE